MIRLEKIDWDNYGRVLKLRVAKDQENFIASNKASLIHAFLAVSEGNPVFAYAIYHDKKIVGFIQMGYDNDWTAEEREDWLNSDAYKAYEGKNYYFIWRFMIDKKYQHLGYGREALRQAIEFLKTEPCGKAEYITLSYEPSNTVAKNLYASFGFYEPAEFAPYYHEEDEVVALLKL